MFRLFRSLCNLIGFLVILLVGLYFFRESLAKYLLEWSLNHYTPFALNVDRVTIPPQLPLQLKAQNLFLKNPIDFPRTEAATLPQFELTMQEKVWDQNQVQIEKMTLTIDELIIIKTSSAGINFTRFTSPTTSPKSFLHIQTVEVFLRQILYYDYTQSTNPQPITYPLDGQPYYFYDLHHFQQIPSHIAKHALQRISLNSSP